MALTLSGAFSSSSLSSACLGGISRGWVVVSTQPNGHRWLGLLCLLQLLLAWLFLAHRQLLGRPPLWATPTQQSPVGALSASGWPGMKYGSQLWKHDKKYGSVWRPDELYGDRTVCISSAFFSLLSEWWHVAGSSPVSPQQSRGQSQRKRTAVLQHAAVRQRLVTVSDNFRGLWSAPLQLYLCLLPRGREGKAASLGSCHYSHSSLLNWLKA